MEKVTHILSDLYHMVQENRKARANGLPSIYASEDLVAIVDELVDAMRGEMDNDMEIGESDSIRTLLGC